MRSAESLSTRQQASAAHSMYNWRVYLLATIASMGAVIFGYDLAFIGTTMSLKPFEEDFGLLKMSKTERDAFSANVVSLLQAGCFFGALAAAPLADRFGRKIALMIAAIVFIAGSAMQTWSNGGKGLLYSGRAVGGLGVGAASGLVPLFISEASPPAIRGRLVGIYEIGVQFGTLIGFWICYGVNQHIAPGRQQYIIPFAFQLIPGGILLIGILGVPESPRWIARSKGREATIDVLSQLRQLPRDDSHILEEAAAILAQIEDELSSVRRGGIAGELQEMLGQSLNRRRMLLGVFIFIFMQFAGSNAINFYSPRIFKSIGLTGTNTQLISTGAYGTVRFVVVCISTFFFVDRFGRTSLLLIGSSGMAVTMYYLGGFVTANPSSTNGLSGKSPASILAAIAVYIYAVFFSLSWAGVPWIYVSEIYPTCIRSLAVSICTATHWLFNFVIARSVPYMISNTRGGVYFLFAACLTLSIPFVWFCLPETKGRWLEDMEYLFSEATRTRFGRIVGGQGSHHLADSDSGSQKGVVVTMEEKV